MLPKAHSCNRFHLPFSEALSRCHYLEGQGKKDGTKFRLNPPDHSTAIENSYIGAFRGLIDFLASNALTNVLATAFNA
jgi:hypothetical protein